MKKRYSAAFFFRKQHIIPLFIFVLLGALHVSAQAPQWFSYQGAVRDAGGQVVSNASIGYKFSIHRAAPIGPVVYSMEGTAVTNGSGVFNAIVGTYANPIPDTIQWHANTYFLQVGIDVNASTDGLNYVDIGTTQLLSVPYALHSALSRKWVDNEPILQKGIFNQGGPLPSVGNGPRLLWHPKLAAFRAGAPDNNQWNEAELGNYSFASGQGTHAKGQYSVAMGLGASAAGEGAFAAGISNTSSGSASVSLGVNSTATGNVSFAAGFGSSASGSYSFAAGEGTVAKSSHGFVVGTHNDISDIVPANASSTGGQDISNRQWRISKLPVQRRNSSKKRERRYWQQCTRASIPARHRRPRPHPSQRVDCRHLF